MAQQLCAAAESPVTERTYSPLVALQTGTPAHTPVFCIPGAGANVGSFVALAAALGKETPVYGLQPRGLDGVAVPYASVETAARDYVKAIRQLYPDGRVNLLGHSFGGWVACEIARQLHAAGCGRPALVLVDSLPPGGAAAAAEYTHAMVLRDMAAVLQEAAAQPLDLALDELQQASEAEQYALLHRAMVAAGLMPERSLPNALRGPLRSFARCLRTAYTPEGQYPGPLLLVQAAGSAAAAGEEARRAQEQAWRNYAPRLQAWCAPGNHMTVLGEAHAAALAARLRAEWEVAAKTALAAQ
ncbi:alpha/beta fold hydrolase [Massilia sp. MB5]|uniref:thioesterase domain-containing protein n=1 Tax=Massilia sp. MB5 TaxID=2919578 RepID=UPI001F0FE2BB|nr:alpha/beta fold hydrolase [Massilia sp. MB5]UMR29749.1 alpha/beta fold hydrolase [Massilia sp. MB5]